MSDKRRAMADEILEFVKEHKKRNGGDRPTQQQLDDYIYSWRLDELPRGN